MTHAVKINQARFARADLGFKRRTTPQGREVVRFEMADRSEVIEVEVVGDEIILVPERSASHRALKAHLDVHE